MPIWWMSRAQCGYQKCKRLVAARTARTANPNGTVTLGSTREIQSPFCEHHTCLVYFNPVADGLRCRKRTKTGVRYCSDHGVCTVLACHEPAEQADGHNFCAANHECKQPDCKNARRQGTAFNAYTETCADHACQAGFIASGVPGTANCLNLKGSSPHGNPNLCARHTCNRASCGAEVPGNPDKPDHQDNWCDEHRLCALSGEASIQCREVVWRPLLASAALRVLSLFPGGGGGGLANLARSSKFCRRHTCCTIRTENDVQYVSEVCDNPAVANGVAGAPAACPSHKCQISPGHCTKPRRDRTAGGLSNATPTELGGMLRCMYCVDHECKRDGCVEQKERAGVDRCREHMCKMNIGFDYSALGSGIRNGERLVCNKEPDAASGTGNCKDHCLCSKDGCRRFKEVVNGVVTAYCDEHHRKKCDWPFGCLRSPIRGSRGCHYHRCMFPGQAGLPPGAPLSSCYSLRGLAAQNTCCDEHTCADSTCLNPRSTVLASGQNGTSLGGGGGNINAVSAEDLISMFTRFHGANVDDARRDHDRGNPSAEEQHLEWLYANTPRPPTPSPSPNSAQRQGSSVSIRRRVHWRPNEHDRPPLIPPSSSPPPPVAPPFPPASPGPPEQLVDFNYFEQDYQDRRQREHYMNALLNSGFLPSPFVHMAHLRGAVPTSMFCDSHRCFVPGCAAKRIGRCGTSGRPHRHRRQHHRRDGSSSDSSAEDANDPGSVSSSDDSATEEIIYCESHQCHFTARKQRAVWHEGHGAYFAAPGRAGRGQKWRCKRRTQRSSGGGFCREHNAVDGGSHADRDVHDDGRGGRGGRGGPPFRPTGAGWTAGWTPGWEAPAPHGGWDCGGGGGGGGGHGPDGSRRRGQGWEFPADNDPRGWHDGFPDVQGPGPGQHGYHVTRW